MFLIGEIEPIFVQVPEKHFSESPGLFFYIYHTPKLSGLPMTTCTIFTDETRYFPITFHDRPEPLQI